MQYSITIAGAIASFLAFLATTLNVQLPYSLDEIKNAIITVLGVAGFLATLYGRWRHGDLDIFGFKHKKLDE